MTRRPTAHAIDVWRALLRYHRLTLNQLDEELRAERGLSLDEYDVLVQLVEAGRPLRMGELVDATLIARSSCTRVVDRLVVAGYVTRSSEPGDRRTVVVALTPEGKGAQRRAAITHLAGIGRCFAGRLTERQLAALGSALESLSEP